MITDTKYNDYDSIFDALVAIKDDEKKFDAMKQEIIEEYLSSVPSSRQTHLRRKQWRIEQELNKHKNPMGKLQCMQKMFYDQFEDFRTTLNNAFNGALQSDKKEPVILEFKNKEDSS